MILTICSRLPDHVPDLVFKNVRSFVISSEGVSIIREVTKGASLVSEWIPFGSIYICVSWSKEK